MDWVEGSSGVVLISMSGFAIETTGRPSYCYFCCQHVYFTVHVMVCVVINTFFCKLVETKKLYFLTEKLNRSDSVKKG